MWSAEMPNATISLPVALLINYVVFSGGGKALLRSEPVSKLTLSTSSLVVWSGDIWVMFCSPETTASKAVESGGDSTLPWEWYKTCKFIKNEYNIIKKFFRILYVLYDKWNISMPIALTVENQKASSSIS